MKLGEPLAERKKLIIKLLKNPQDKFNLIFKNDQFELPVITLPIGTLLYRVENGREYWDVREHEQLNELPEGYFLENKEDKTVQEQMHKWLYARAIQGQEDLRKEYGKEGARQMHPLIINNRTDGFVGFVVDGNRRLSLWRQMYQDDRSKYSTFKNIQCAVLPTHFDDEMERSIEMDLQIKKSLKADYDWPNDRELKERALNFYPDRKAGVKSVSKEFNISEGRLRQELKGYDLAKEYIERTRLPMSSLLEDMQAFLTLGQELAKSGRTETQRSELKDLGFNIIKKDKTSPAKHKQIQSLSQELVEITKTIAKDPEVPEKPENPEGGGVLKPEARGGGDDGPPSYITGRTIGDLTDVTIAAIKEINRKKDEINITQEPLRNIRRISSSLKTFSDTLGSNSRLANKEDIKKEVEKAIKILGKVNKNLTS